MKHACTLVVLFGLLLTARGADPVIARVLDREILLSEKEEMNGIIFSTLLEKFAAENGATATKADIDAHIKALKKMSAKNHEASLAARAGILADLEKKDLSDAEKGELQEKLKMYDLFVTTDREMDDYAAAHPEESAKSDEDMATIVVQSWKVNQALHRKYGGRVIFQQGGPEPLDAYRTFLREQEKTGAFQIIDPSYEAAFWNYYTNDTIHTFYPPDDAKKSMETPWWLMEKPLGE